MMTVIETNRLLVRPFQQGDAEVAHAWFGNDVVMKHTPTGPDKSIQETQTRLTEYQTHQDSNGFSKWLILDRETRLPIGDSGLLTSSEFDWIDLGIRFAQPYWGRGLATEVGRAWIKKAFGELGLEQLGAFIHLEHSASIGLIKKLGFRFEREDIVMGMSSHIFTCKPSDVHVS